MGENEQSEGFRLWFAERYGIEFDQAEKLQGKCDGCGDATQVLVVHPAAVVGDGVCVPCLRERFDRDENDLGTLVTAIRTIWEGDLPTPETVAEQLVQAYKRYAGEFEEVKAA